MHIKVSDIDRKHAITIEKHFSIKYNRKLYRNNIAVNNSLQ